MPLSKTTKDHDEIRRWAEARGAKPAEVATSEHNGQTGIIRLEFPSAPHHNDSALKEISWKDFFERFDASGLTFTYQDETADGETSNFNKLVYLEDPKASSKKSTRSSSSSSHGSSRKKTTAKQSGTKASGKSAKRAS